MDRYEVMTGKMMPLTDGAHRKWGFTGKVVTRSYERLVDALIDFVETGDGLKARFLTGFAACLAADRKSVENRGFGVAVRKVQCHRGEDGTVRVSSVETMHERRYTVDDWRHGASRADRERSEGLKGWTMSSVIELYEHNQKAYDALLDMLGERDRACIIKPTGTGKFVIIAKMVQDNPDKRFLLLGTNDYMFNDQMANLAEIAPGFTPENLQFMTYAAAMGMERRNDCVPPYDVIIADEFHHCGAEEWGKAMAEGSQDGQEDSIFRQRVELSAQFCNAPGL